MTILLQAAGDAVVDERFWAMREKIMQDDPGTKWVFLRSVAIIAAAPVVILSIVLIYRRFFGGGPVQRPMRLLWDLARTASLSIPDRLLLMRIARAAVLPQPAAMLLSSACFDRAVQTWTGPDAPRPHRVNDLRRRIFGASP